MAKDDDVKRKLDLEKLEAQVKASTEKAAKRNRELNLEYDAAVKKHVEEVNALKAQAEQLRKEIEKGMADVHAAEMKHARTVAAFEKQKKAHEDAKGLLLKQKQALDAEQKVVEAKVAAFEADMKNFLAKYR
jgi:chromosome segregation ATPase